jgi:hypothetical protein
VSVATYNDATDAYDGYTGTVRKNATGTIKTADSLGAVERNQPNIDRHFDQAAANITRDLST